jgi:hypothetical protein
MWTVGEAVVLPLKAFGCLPQSPSTCPTTPQAGGSIAALPMVGPISSISGASSSPKPGTKGSSSDAASVSLTALAAAGMLAVAVRNAF